MRISTKYMAACKGHIFIDKLASNYLKAPCGIFISMAEGYPSMRITGF